MRRFHTSFGSSPEIQAVFHMSGPQTEHQLPPEVVALMDRLPKIKSVSVVFDYGLGERIEVFRRMEGE